MEALLEDVDAMERLEALLRLVDVSTLPGITDDTSVLSMADVPWTAIAAADVTHDATPSEIIFYSLLHR